MNLLTILSDNRINIKLEIRSVERGICHSERTVPVIMAGCIVHARNDHISNSDVKSDAIIVFLDTDFL